MTVYALILYVCTVTASSGWPSAAPFDRYCAQAGHNSGLYTTLAVCQAHGISETGKSWGDDVAGVTHSVQSYTCEAIQVGSS